MEATLPLLVRPLAMLDKETVSCTIHMMQIPTEKVGVSVVAVRLRFEHCK
jgi:hypothetical protein